MIGRTKRALRPLARWPLPQRRAAQVVPDREFVASSQTFAMKVTRRKSFDKLKAQRPYPPQRVFGAFQSFRCRDQWSRQQPQHVRDRTSRCLAAFVFPPTRFEFDPWHTLQSMTGWEGEHTDWSATIIFRRFAQAGFVLGRPIEDHRHGAKRLLLVHQATCFDGKGASRSQINSTFALAFPPAHSGD